MTTDTITMAKPRTRTAIATGAVVTEAKPATPAAPAAKATPATATKSAAVIKLLLRGKGATAIELIAATDWQPHSVRAFLSGLRKKGRMIAREPRKNGEAAYRIVAVADGAHDGGGAAEVAAGAPVADAGPAGDGATEA